MTIADHEYSPGRARLRRVSHDLRATPNTVHCGYFDAALATIPVSPPA